MKFSAIVQALKRKGYDFTVDDKGEDPSVSDVFSDSRKILPGAVFCCIRGEKNDGHQYVFAVQEAGAVALICEYPVEADVPVVIVESAREIMGEVASLVYGEPASKLLMVGVTGTNGKSTTTYILRSILQAAGLKTGLLGTIVESDGVRERDAERTTPESCDVQRQLASMVRNGCKACVMETSSHGLQVGRLNGCRFDRIVFTNLNPEHLDFHGDMENYFQAKRLLFTKYAKDKFTASVNADDPYGERLLDEFPGNARGFSITSRKVFAGAFDVRLDLEGSSFKIKIDTKDSPVLHMTSPLVGNFNVSNVLAAVTALRGAFDDDAIVRGVTNIPQVPGRLERYMMQNGACCIIDFAHTPEALRNVLSAVRAFCSGKLISIFGHGGGRYPSNRPALGRVAASLADLIIVTMDNPRDEDPASIAQSIVQGIEEYGKEEQDKEQDKVKQLQEAKHQVILDRKEAIFTALSIAGSGDVLVISGKGPEKFLTVKDQKIPYSDAETVNEWKKL